MEALAVLRLNVAPTRSNDGHAVLEGADDIAVPTPYTSPPSSPRHAFTVEVEEFPLGEVRAAIPFVWELIPGTPRDDFEMQPVDVGVSSAMSEETGSESHGSLRGSEDSESLSRDSSKIEFEFCNRFEGVAAPRSPSMTSAHELLSTGQVVPLRLPPRLQAVRHLRNSDSSEISSKGSFKSCHSPQAPQSPHVSNMGSKLTLCGFMRTLESEPEEVTVLGMQERKQKTRSLSPLRFFSTERSSGSNLSSETYFSRDSVSSASSFSSSSSGAETNVESPKALWDSPNGKRNEGRTRNEPGPHMAIASRGIEELKVSSINETTQDRAKPQMVESGRELLEKHQDNASPAAAEKIYVIPQLSPSYSRSRPSSSPSVEMHFKSSRREYLGRVLFANRFGMLGSCLGIPPESP